MKTKQLLKQAGKSLGWKLSLPVSGLLGVFVAAGLLSVYLIRQNPSTVGLLKGPEILKKEQEEFVAEVGKSIKLPEGQPTIAEVTDLEKLSGQVFFEQAAAGDKVLIYADAKKVILYRPLEKRVVEVGSINVESQDGEVAGVAAETVAVALLNGTEEKGATTTIEEKLKQVMPQAEVKLKTNAAKTDYEKSLVVDMTGNQGTVVESLAKDLGMEVGSLPEGEKVRDGIEVLIIVGKDKLE
jgi:hypothetical protein